MTTVDPTADLNTLSGLSDEVPGESEVQDMAEAPGQIGSFYPTPRPGTYIFRLPQVSPRFEQFFDKETKPRLKVHFSDDAKLAILSLGEQPFQQQISGLPIARGKQKIKVSDLNYFLAALGEAEIPPGPKSQAGLVSRHLGETFRADIEWKGYCNPAKDIYKYNEKLQRSEKQENLKGCGKEYRQRSYEKKDGTTVFQIPPGPDGAFLDEFECSCGAAIRVFPQLTNFQPVK